MPIAAFLFAAWSGATLLQAATVTDAPIPLYVTESDDVRFTRLSTREGLSHNRVEHILQDDQGFLWFGTGNGLNRYDGYSFKVFRHDAAQGSLSGVTVTALFKDRAGVLWIGVDKILNKYNAATETFQHYRPESTLGVIFGIFGDRLGRIWLAASHGLASLDQATGKFTYYRHRSGDPSSLAGHELSFALEDRSGVLWLVSSVGLDSMDTRTSQISHRERFRQAENAFWPDTRLYEDRHGLLWMFSSSGTELDTIDRNSGAIRRYAFSKKEAPALIKVGILAMREDEEGILWLGTGGNGLIRFDRRNKTLVRYRNQPGVPGSLSNDFVFSLFEDREGTIWAGTGGGGISHFQRKPLPFRSYQHLPADPNSLQQNYIISAFPDSRGLLWIGNDKVLNCLDRSTGRYVFYRHDTADPTSISMASVTSTVEDAAGFLWFGTYGGGLNRFNPQTKRFKAYHSDKKADALSSDLIFTLMLDPGGTLWIGTDNGLDRFDPRSERFTQFRAEAPVPILRIAQDRAGWLWLATMGGGLYSFDPQSERFRAFRQNDSSPIGLSDDHVNALHLDRSGLLWVGTQNGLDAFDPRKAAFLASFHEPDGLADNAVQSIEEDSQGNLWISTSRGLSRFQPRTRRFTNFYDSDGLAGNDFGVLFPASARSAGGEMFFGGVDGLTSFYPDRVNRVDNHYVAPVVLTDFRINNIPVTPGQGSALPQTGPQMRQLNLSYQQNILSFEFSALSYFNPARNRYRYRLEGLESKWNEAGSDHRFVTYTKLPPGDYVFRVQGSNNIGMWNENGARVGIHIAPPWWGAFWFRVALGISLALTAWGAYRYWLHLVTRQLNLRADERVAERTRIARELHDTMLQSFQGALLKLYAVTYMIRNRPDEATAALERIIEQAGSAIAEGREAVTGLRSTRAIRTDLATALQGLGEALAADQHGAILPEFRLSVEGPSRELLPLVVDEAYRVAGEALRNAFRHAGAGKIEVGIHYDKRQFRVRVRDDGKGIETKILDAGGRNGHYGFAGMKERAKLAGGELTIWSRIGSGTVIEIGVPASVAYRKSTLTNLPVVS